MMHRALLTCLLIGAATATLAQDQVLARNGWTTVTKADFDAELARIPKEQRPGFLASAQRVAVTVESILVTKTLAAQARAAKLDSEPEVKSEVALATDKVLAKVMTERDEAGLQVPDFTKRAEELYKANPAKYTEKTALHTKHILVDTKCRTLEAAKARALEARAEIVSGARFEDVARKYSDDPTVQRNGGDLGPIAEDQLVPAFVEGIQGLKVGDLSQPVQTQFGVHVIRLEAVRKGRLHPYPEVRDSILLELREDWLKQQRKAYVEKITADPKLKLDFDAIQSLKTNVSEPAPQPPQQRPG